MNVSIEPLLDLLVIVTVFIVKVFLLRVILRRIARHEADAGFFKAMVVVLLAGGICRLVTLADPPYALVLATVAGFVMALLLVRLMCWLGWLKAAIAALPYAILAAGLTYGVARAAHAIAPERKTFLQALAEAQKIRELTEGGRETFSVGAVLARALEGLAQLSAPDETERLTEDMSRGMAVYRERRALVSNLATVRIDRASQPTALTALETLATGDVSEITADLTSRPAIMAVSGQGMATSPPPQSIEESLAQIHANMSSERGKKAMAALMAVGVGGATELATDAATLQRSNPQAATNVLRVLTIAQRISSTNLPGNLATLPAAPTVTAEQVARALAAGNGMTARITPQATEGSVPGTAVGATAGKAERGPSGESLIPATSPENIADSRRHPSYARLNVSGIMGTGSRAAVLCNGKVMAPGHCVAVEHEGQHYTWQLAGVREGRPLWRFVGQGRPAMEGF